MTPGDTGKIAVVMSRFPKFTETFVVNEILGLEARGVAVEIFPLLPEQPGPHQPRAEPLVRRAHFGRPWGLPAIAALVDLLITRPGCLVSIVLRLIADTWRAPTMLVKDLYLIPRTCAIADQISSSQVSHIHAHFLTHGGFAAWALGRITGLPYSVVAHGSDVHRHQGTMTTKVAEAEFIAAISEFNRSVIRRRCGEVGRVEVVHCGIDVAHIVPAGRHDRAPDPLVVCVGTLHEVKGQRHLIEAVAELKRRGRRVDVELIGSGRDHAKLADLAAWLDVDDRVTLTGSLEHGQVIERYRRAHIMVAPSVPSSDGRREGIPTVIMEAMAAGTPVIASALSGIPELVIHGETGLLVEPGDAVGIADAIARLLDDENEAAALAAEAGRRVREDFDITSTTARLAELMKVGAMHRSHGVR